MATLPGTSTASDSVDDEEARSEVAVVVDALSRAIKALPPSDRVLVQLHFWSGHTVARIAARTGDNQKALYRRFDKLKAELRRRLEAEGVSQRTLAGIEGRFEPPENGDDYHGEEIGGEPAEVGTVTTRPSTERRTGGENA